MEFNYEAQKAPNYFVVNQDEGDDKPDFQYVAPVKKIVRDQKGAKGILYMFISSLFFSMMAFLLKLLYLNSQVTTYEVTYWQSIMMIFLNMALFKAYKKDHLEVPRELRTTVIVRGFTGFVGMSGFYLALEFTDLSKATALYWTNPMFTAFISSIMINEALTFLDWLAIFVSFAGIIVIENPWSIHTLIETQSELVSTQSLIGSSAAIIGAVFFAVSQMQTRKLGKKVHFLVPPFYQAIVSAFIAPMLMFIMLRYRQSETTTYGYYELGMVVLLSLSMFAAQVFQTKSYQNDKAGRVAPVNQLQIIFNWLLDFLYIGTRPKANDLIGGIMIIGSNLTISFLRCFNLIK